MTNDGWLASLAGLGLPGAAPVDEIPGPVGELCAAVSAHRLLGVLAAALADRALDPGPDVVAEIARAHERSMREVLLLEDVLLDAVEVLTAAGVDHRVLKGAALAHLVPENPSERGFGDNDVLVAAADIDSAVGALLAAGAARPVPPLSASFDRRFAKSVTLRWRGATELDLHRTLAAGPYGFLIDRAELFRDPVEILLAGRTVRTLPTDLHLLHGAIHVALGDVEARLGNVRDVAQLARRVGSDLDRVVDTATRWRCAAPVAVGLRTTRALGHDLSPIERWAHSYEIDAVDRRRLIAYSTRAGRFRRQARASWRVLGWRDRAAFGAALLVPSAANRGVRRGSRVQPPRRRRSD
jgi:Uncharacterised nucleotidyltransferase